MATLIHELSVNGVLLLSAKVTLLLLVAWMVHLCLPRANPRWRVWLWRSALVGVTLLPIFERLTPSWPIAVVAEQPAINQESSYDRITKSSAVAPPTALSPANETIVTVPVEEHSTEDIGVADAGGVALATETRTGSRVDWLWVAFSFWLLGVGLLTFRLIRNGIRVQHFVRHAQPASEAVMEIAQKVTREIGLRSTPEIRVSPSIAVPVATGIVRPMVILPTTMHQPVDETELELILAHELGHIAGYDVPWNIFSLLVQAVLWFHPLTWRLPAAHQLACEMVCDALASRNESARKAYRRMLARLALACRGNESATLGAAMSATAEITRRVRRLASPISCERLSLHRQITATSLGIIGLVAISAASLVPLAEAEEPPVAASPAEVPEEDRPSDSTWKIRLRAIDADTGRSIANPHFVVQLGKQETYYAGNEQGEFVVDLPTRTPAYCYLKVRAEGYTPMRGFWRTSESLSTRDPLPEEVTFQMKPGITVGGVVLNEQQQPVQGATVLFSAGAHQPGQRITPTFWQEEYTTDEEGRWRCEIAPRGMSSGSININHPDYALYTSNRSVDKAIDELKTQTYQWTLRDSFTIRGVVTDPKGVPVSGAHLAVGTLNAYSDDGPFAVTDEDGRYEFRRIGSMTDKNGAAYQMSVTVLAPDFAPQMELVPGTGEREIGESTQQERIMNFRLNKGKPLTVRLSDAEGKPVENAWIFPRAWRDDTDGLRVLGKHGIPQYTDKNGLWRWETAPADESIRYDVLGRGFMDLRNEELIAGREYAFKLVRPQVLTGKVVDADTQEPIDEFVIQKGFERFNSAEYIDGVYWTSESQERNGAYRRVVSMPSKSYRWRFVADGYESFSSDSIPVDEGEFVLNVELKKSVRKDSSN